MSKDICLYCNGNKGHETDEEGGMWEECVHCQGSGEGSSNSIMESGTKGMFVPTKQWDIIERYIRDSAQVGGKPHRALRSATELVLLDMSDRLEGLEDSVKRLMPRGVYKYSTERDQEPKGSSIFSNASRAVREWETTVEGLRAKVLILRTLEPVISLHEKLLIGYYTEYIVEDMGMVNFVSKNGPVDFSEYYKTFAGAEQRPQLEMLSCARKRFAEDLVDGLYKCSEGHSSLKWQPEKGPIAYPWLCTECGYPYPMFQVTRVLRVSTGVDPSASVDPSTDTPDSIKDQ